MLLINCTSIDDSLSLCFHFQPGRDNPTVAVYIVDLDRAIAKKPVLKLLDEDYNEHVMSDLLTEHGPGPVSSKYHLLDKS